MATVVEEIPDTLRPAAEAALAWVNREQNANFKLTGLADIEEALEADPGRALELGLVLCEGDRCLREQVRVTPRDEGFEITGVDLGDAIIPPLLDPPAGVRAGWIDEQLAQHAFIVLLFYRGLW